MGEDISLPLGILVGLCGISGSGKSTLAVDTLGRALAPKKLTSSVAYEQIEPGRHEAIKNVPPRTVVIDQTAAGVKTPAAFLGISVALRRAFASSDAARTAGLGEKELAAPCDSCHGRGVVREEMGFLPTITYSCEACEGTGYTTEARELVVRGRSLADTEALEISEVLDAWGDVNPIATPLDVAVEVGLGYLVLRQPAVTLSGGERQRLKLV